MNKILISEEIDKNQKVSLYSEEFNPQEIKIKYFNFDGLVLKPNDEIKCFDFEAEVPGFDRDSKTKFIRKIKFPELNYISNNYVKVLVEYYEIEEI